MKYNFFPEKIFIAPACDATDFPPGRERAAMTGSLDVILLASGFSTRFGRDDKILRNFRGKPLLAHALELVCSLPRVDSVFFIYASDEVARTAGEWEGRMRPIRNTRPERGLCESVRLGVDASSAAFYLFVPCDQPLLDASTVAAVVSRRRQGGIVVPCHAGRPGNPALFSSFFRQELLALPDGDTPRTIKQRYPDRVESVEIADPWPLRDVDTEEDLRHLEQFWSRIPE